MHCKHYNGITTPTCDLYEDGFDILELFQKRADIVLVMASHQTIDILPTHILTLSEKRMDNPKCSAD